MSTLRLSNSEASAFRRCRRKWYVSYYRRLRSRSDGRPGSALSLGSLVHDALAAYYDPEQRADPVAHVERVIAASLQRLEPEEQFLAEDLTKEGELARIMLEGYLEWLTETGADQDLVILGVERMVEVPLLEGVTLISKLDAPVERVSDGAKLALEHKTTGSLEARLEGARLDTQLLTEHLVRFKDAMEKGATAEEAYDQCHGVLLNMLRKVKRTARANPPFYGRETVPHNIHELRNHWRHTVAIAREILDTTRRLDQGEDPQLVCPPNPMPDRCSWDCPLYKVCGLFDDGSDVEGALGALFEEHDPLERYEGVESL